MAAKKVLVMGVAGSGTTAIYSLLQKMLQHEYPDAVDFVFEPFLWKRDVFNKSYEEVEGELSLVSSIDIDGVFFNKKIPLFSGAVAHTKPSVLSKLIKMNFRRNKPVRAEGLDNLSIEYIDSSLSPISKNMHLLCTTTRGNGRLELIKSIVPDVKIIFVIRNPVDVINNIIDKASFFGDDFHESDFPRFLEEIQRSEGQAMEKKFPLDTKEERAAAYWYFMNQAAIRAYQNDSTNIFPVVYEDFIDKKQPYIDGLCDFIGLNKVEEYNSYKVDITCSIDNEISNLTKQGFEYIRKFDNLYENFVLALDVTGDSFHKKKVSHKFTGQKFKQSVSVGETKNGLYAKYEIQSCLHELSSIKSRSARENAFNVRELASIKASNACDLSSIKANFESELSSIKSRSAIVEKYVASLAMATNQLIEAPRILVISSTPIGSDSATGMLMESLFEGHYENIFQIYSRPRIERELVRSFNLLEKHDQLDLENIVKAFSPTIIYFRPAEDPWYFCQKAYRFMLNVDVPYVCHVMDDWITRVDEEKAEWLSNKFSPVLKKAAINFTISQKMSAAYERRYHIKCTDAANFIESNKSFVKKLPCINKPLKILYCGGISDDMNFSSIKNIAEAVKKFSAEDVIFDLHIPDWHKDKATPITFNEQVNVRDYVIKGDYMKLLCSADILIIAYNFDERSVDYCRYSMANKLSDCISAIAPILFVGSPEIATMSFADEHNLGRVVEKNGVEPIYLALKDMMLRYENYSAKALLNYNKLKDSHSKDKVVMKFQKTLSTATSSNFHLLKRT
jgi:hypothetical protein